MFKSLFCMYRRLCGVENFTFFFFALYSTILYIARQDRTSNYNSVIPGRDGLKPASMPLERMKVILQVLRYLLIVFLEFTVLSL